MTMAGFLQIILILATFLTSLVTGLLHIRFIYSKCCFARTESVNQTILYHQINDLKCQSIIKRINEEKKERLISKCLYQLLIS